MRRLGLLWRNIWWTLVLLKVLLYSSAASGQLALTSSGLNFGSVQVGNSSTLSISVSNASKSNITISQASAIGAGFSFSGPSLPITLAPQQNANLYVTFAPQSSGSTNGTLSVMTGSAIGNSGKQRSNSATISLSGTGTSSGQLAANPSILNFGTAPVGTSQSMTGTLTNSTTSSVTVSQASVTGTGFGVSGLPMPLNLAPGQSQAFNVTFTPQASGTASGSLAVVSTAPNPTLNISLSGTAVTPGYLTANPSSVNFGSIQVGSSQTQYESLTNSGGSSVTISQVAASGTGFTLSGLVAPQTLSPGQSITFSLAFAPTLSGTASGSLSVVSDASDPSLSISLSGTGTSPGQLSVSPGSMSFGTVTVGANQSQAGALSASGSSVTVSSASSSSSEFALSGITLPVTIAAGQSVPFTLTFAPQVSGSTSANILFSSNASDSSLAESATGTGAVQHTVDLSWSPSSSTVAGYNVYRGGVSGGPYTRINSSPGVLASYTDTAVQSGQTYYYVTTAVDSTGAESGYSNEASALVPTP
jgi:hypothetical protein